MRRALTDLRYLWTSRKSSGFPWPIQSGFGWSDKAWMVVFGQSIHSVQPVWKQTLGIPLRPWRYARMVRRIARTRAVFFTTAMYDDVP